MLASRYRSTYRHVYEGSEMGKRRVRESSVVHWRVALCTEGQRDCAQEGSVTMAGCHSLLN